MSFSEIVSAFDIEDYLTEQSRVRKSGPTNLVVNDCPICGDRRGKFYINASRGERHGTWNTYCCHDKGGLVKLVATVESITEAEAVEFIRSRVDGEDIVIPLIKHEPAPTAVETIQFPSPMIPATPSMSFVRGSSVSTLGDRGVDDYIINRHQLRVTGQTAMLNGTVRHDVTNRLVIPVPTNDGRGFISWQGRDLSGKAKNKYLFPPGDRSTETLYGIHEHIGPSIVIVEGAFHKWAWDRLGRFLGMPQIEYISVASFGKKLTEPQENLLMSIPDIKRVFIAWDLDATSQVLATAERLVGRKEVYVVESHPSGRDHDELTPRELMQLFTDAKPYTREFAVQMSMRVAMMGAKSLP